MFCVTLSDPIRLLGLGFDSICFGSCLVSHLLFCQVMFVLAFWVIAISVSDCGSCLILG